MKAFEEISFLFKDRTHKFSEIMIDALIKESHELRAQATEHPTESGESFCDHVQLLPTCLQIEGIITNTPLNFIGVTANFFSKEANDLAEIAFRKLDELFLKREPITIATSLKAYKGMVLESLSIERGAHTSESLHFRASAKQIRMVEQALIDLPKPKAERTKPKQRMKKQESKPASEEIKKETNKIDSALTKIFGGLFK